MHIFAQKSNAMYAAEEFNFVPVTIADAINAAGDNSNLRV